MSVIMRKLARKQMRANVGLTQRVAREHLVVLQGIEAVLVTAYRTIEAIDDAVCLAAVSSAVTGRAAKDPLAAMLADKFAQVRSRLANGAKEDWLDALRVVGQSIQTHSSCAPGDVGYLGFIDHYLP
jgi:hypothetical protein